MSTHESPQPPDQDPFDTETHDGLQEEGGLLSRRNLLMTGLGLGASATVAVLLGGRFGNEPQGGANPESPKSASAAPLPTPESSAGPRKEGLRDEIAQHRAAQIISTFENSTTEIQYGYAEDIDDGRGITAGRAGFCSGTGDMLMVVERYTEAKPDNTLARYLKPLQKIDKEFEASNWEDPVDSTEGLIGDGYSLIADWTEAAKKDKAFLAAQDNVFNELYLEPALKRAEAVEIADGKGVRTAVGQLVILDTIIQHGAGTDKDGLPSIMDEVAKKVGDKPTEDEYIKTFLDVRQKHLENAADESTRSAWRESVPRVKALRQIFKSGNEDLRGRLKFDVYQGDRYDLPAIK
ncbi:MAG TPA: chitosanase [Candidatus Saccharimonadales bacterium]|jgi:chitosanase